MYKTESTLGLIGNILGIIAAVFTLIFSLIIGIFVGGVASYGAALGAEFTDEYAAAATAAVAGSIVGVVIAVILVIAAVVLGFIGTAKLKKEDKKGGILLIVAGGLGFISLFMGGWFGFATVALYLTGGIMAVAKKTSAAPMAPPPAAPVQ